MQDRSNVETVAEHLDGARAFHGGMSYKELREAIDSFMANDIRILVATDVLSRGAFGSANIVMIINFDVPVGAYGTANMKVYTLRCARAGQFGRVAIVVDFTRIEYMRKNRYIIEANF